MWVFKRDFFYYYSLNFRPIPTPFNSNFNLRRCRYWVFLELPLKKSAYGSAEALDLGMGGVQYMAEEIKQVIEKCSDISGKNTSALSNQANCVQQLLKRLSGLRMQLG